MSVDLAKEEILRFLLSKEPEVLCLRGKWGTGKTYAWNSVLQQQEGNAALKRYSYVSMFGLNSLAEVKDAIFENTVETKNANLKPTLESFKENAAAVLTSLGRKSFSFVATNPLLNKYVSGLSNATSLTIRNQIVCFDDLERKGAKLSLRDIFGLTTFLKEQRDCKIVLILNDGALDRDEGFERYFEKVVDASLVYSPNAIECAKIGAPGETLALETLRENCVALGITNIRVIQQIRRHLESLTSLKETLDPSILKQIIQTLILLTWSKRAEDGIPLDFIQNKRGAGHFSAPDREKMTEEEKRWSTVLDKYGFGTLDSLDRLLLDGVERGYFDNPAIKSLVDEKLKDLTSARLRGSFSSAWNLYHYSLNDNQAELISALEDAVSRGIQQISPGGLNSTVKLFKELGQTDKAAQLIHTYVEKRHGDKSAFDFSEPFFSHDVSDPDVIAAFKKEFALYTKDFNASEILFRIAKNSGWNPEDLVYLSGLSETDYYTVFKQAGENTGILIGACQLFGQIQGATSEMALVNKKATAALERIAGESTLNKLRLARYGIKPSSN